MAYYRVVGEARFSAHINNGTTLDVVFVMNDSIVITEAFVNHIVGKKAMCAFYLRIVSIHLTE